MKLKIAYRNVILTFVTICDNSCVLKVKEALHKMQNVPIESISLSYHGITLDDPRGLFEYRIHNGATLNLELPEDCMPMCHVNLLLPQNKQLPIIVPITATVKEVKRKLLSTCKRQLNCPGLVFDHWSMQDEDSVFRYGIDASSIVMVTEMLSSKKAQEGDVTNNIPTYRIETPTATDEAY